MYNNVSGTVTIVLNIYDERNHIKLVNRNCSMTVLMVSFCLGFAAVVELDSQSQTYKDLSKKFQKTWAKAKGPCPPVITIVKIVNSMVVERFERYRSKFLVYRGTEQHYHGTTLCCDLADYAELCNDLN